MRVILQVKLTSHSDYLSRPEIRVQVQMGYLGANPRKQVGNLVSILLGVWRQESSHPRGKEAEAYLPSPGVLTLPACLVGGQSPKVWTATI